jgi:hypothetical protein
LLFLRRVEVSNDKQLYNTPAGDGKTTYGQRESYGMVITENVQTTRSDGSVVTRDYRAIGEGPVTSDSRDKK